MQDVIREDNEIPDVGIFCITRKALIRCRPTVTCVDESVIINVMSRESVLRSYVNQQRENYDYILIDCAPSLGMLTINALMATA